MATTSMYIIGNGIVCRITATIIVVVIGTRTIMSGNDIAQQQNQQSNQQSNQQINIYNYGNGNTFNTGQGKPMNLKKELKMSKKEKLLTLVLVGIIVAYGWYQVAYGSN